MIAMSTKSHDAITRLGGLLLARMKRNSRSPLAEVWDAESGFAEPDAELVGHLIRYREELACWMRAVLDEETERRARETEVGRGGAGRA